VTKKKKVFFTLTPGQRHTCCKWPPGSSHPRGRIGWTAEYGGRGCTAADTWLASVVGSFGNCWICGASDVAHTLKNSCMKPGPETCRLLIGR